MSTTMPVAAPQPSEPSQHAPAGPARPRLDSVDLLRGLVIVLMALDHVRDYFTNARFDPTDLSQTTPALFLTRWVTHFCAPTFVFLAGTGAFLYGVRGKSRAEVSRFLLTRGLWLVVLEFTVVTTAWFFQFQWTLLPAQVIWAIGVSMIALAGLVRLPLPAVAAVGAVLVAGHNLLDPITPGDVGGLGWLWSVLHEGGQIPFGNGRTFFAAYPLVPWIGVIALGYAFGTWMLLEPERRRRRILHTGLALTVAFVALRATNLYGEPNPWAPQGSGVFTLLSFLNTTKYPPSLLFLLMTLGPAFVVLSYADRWRGRAAGVLVTFGRVPLFFYLIHLYVIHAAAILVSLADRGHADGLFTVWIFYPADYGYGLPVVYLAWVLMVAVLYPACRWFAGVKARRRDPWLSYL